VKDTGKILERYF